MLYAEVAVEAARGLGRETYTYAVPPAAELVPGHRVWVPFGRRRSIGYVVELGAEDPGREVREIERGDPEPLLLPHQIELARSVSQHYWAPLIECLRAMLPPRVRGGRRSSGAGPSPRQTRHSRLLEHASAGPPEEPGPAPNAAQAAALEIIGRQRRVLLRGAAESGRIEVYLAAAAAALGRGLRVLVLVPEISLTPRVIDRFRRRLGVPLAVLHSQLTELERAQQWWRVRRGEADLVIGSRSAVFAPVPRLGLVVLDEEGSGAYKQERTPRYEAGWVARRLAEASGASLVLGSATPAASTYAEALSGALALAELGPGGRGRPAGVELADLREERARGNRLALSGRLLTAIEAALTGGEQAVLLLNRRGAATFVLCRACGRSLECPFCSVSMVQHLELDGLACHYCGFSRSFPELCPSCGQAQLRPLGMGTQRLSGLVRRLWPQARVLRLDRDAARGPDAYLRVLETFASGDADVLIGTQLVAGALDLERVAVAGVIDADLPLRFPDYRAAETAFALIAQVAGRAGRAGRPARVVVQTWNPEHYGVRHAAAGDYAGFVAEELRFRAAFEYPPYAELAVLTHGQVNPERAAASAREAAENLASALVREGIEGIRVLGPSPAFIHRLRGEHRWQITLKGERLDRVRHLVPHGRGWSHDVDPR